MYKLTDTEKKEYQQLVQKHFGVKISLEEAEEEGTKFLRLVETVCKAKIDNKNLNNN